MAGDQTKGSCRSADVAAYLLVGGLVLFSISLGSSLRSFYLTTTTVRKLKLEHAEALERRGRSPFAGAKTKLRKRSASYGAGDPNDVDVTDTLAKMIPRDALAVTVDNNLIAGIPDPAPSVPKALTVHYTFGTSDVVPVVVKEHSLLVLPTSIKPPCWIVPRTLAG